MFRCRPVHLCAVLHIMGMVAQLVSTSTEVFVSIVDDDGYEDTWSAEWSPEQQHAIHHVVPRSAPPEAPLVDRATCLDRLAERRAFHPHLAHLAYPGETVRLPCHHCHDPRTSTHAAHVWYKFFRHERPTQDKVLWRAEEVMLDMHDDMEANRVYTLEDHTLVIKLVEMSDRGTYFCEHYSTMDKNYDFESPQVDAISGMALVQAWERLEEKTTESFLVHLDVHIQVKTQLVTATGDGFYPQPASPVTDTDDNWMVTTEWGEWNACNTCGSVGERTRHGHCVVQRAMDGRTVRPPYLARVLDLYPDGAPCHSTLFVHWTDTRVSEYPRETEVGACHAECHKSKGGDSWIMIADKQIGFGGKFGIGPKESESKMVKSKLYKQTGENVGLRCLGADLMTPVRWENGSTVLLATAVATQTSGRVQIDSAGTLHIYNLTLEDKGSYTCAYSGFKRARYKLNVDYVFQPDPPGPLMFYLYVSWGLSGVVFLLCLCVRHIGRPSAGPGKRRHGRHRRRLRADSRDTSQYSLLEAR